LTVEYPEFGRAAGPPWELAAALFFVREVTFGLGRAGGRFLGARTSGATLPPSSASQRSITVAFERFAEVAPAPVSGSAPTGSDADGNVSVFSDNDMASDVFLTVRAVV
jgi:hypothetical protein